MTAHIRIRGEEVKKIACEADRHMRRWVVERSHSWLQPVSPSANTPGECITWSSRVSPIALRVAE
jgi:hypothetical protein